jgi:GNAT superfamily N-acetyltransferase
LEPPKLEIAREPDAQDARVVREAIYAYNRSKAGDQRYEPLTIFLRDSRGALVGGLLGSTYWQWLTIDFLWVAEDLRGRGHGRQLVMAAEGEAKRRGCKYACLDMFSFQAKGFHERLGYLVFGVLDDFPGRHKRYFLRKKLGT